MDDVRKVITLGSHRFMDRFCLFIRARHLAYKTEKTYCYWVLKYIRFHNRKNPVDMGAREIEEFLEYLSTQRNVAANTQKTALNALIFLYQKFLGIEVGKLRFSYATKPRQIPTVFSHDEASAVIALLRGTSHLVASLMYGSGLRVSEAARLRVQDIEMMLRYIMVRESKGNKTRRTLLPKTLYSRLEQQLERVALLHKSDLLGHTDISTTQIYSHVVGLHERGMVSPVD